MTFIEALREWDGQQARFPTLAPPCQATGLIEVDKRLAATFAILCTACPSDDDKMNHLRDLERRWLANLARWSRHHPEMDHSDTKRLILTLQRWFVEIYADAPAVGHAA